MTQNFTYDQSNVDLDKAANDSLFSCKCLQTFYGPRCATLLPVVTGQLTTVGPIFLQTKPTTEKRRPVSNATDLDHCVPNPCLNNGMCHIETGKSEK